IESHRPPCIAAPTSAVGADAFEHDAHVGAVVEAKDHGLERLHFRVESMPDGRAVDPVEDLASEPERAVVGREEFVDVAVLAQLLLEIDDLFTNAVGAEQLEPRRITVGGYREPSVREAGEVVGRKIELGLAPSTLGVLLDD